MVFYNDRVFFWVVGYLCWEIGGGKIWVIMINVLYMFFMVDVVEIVCKIMMKEKVI